LAFYHSLDTASNPNESNLLKEEFDALVRNEGVREDRLEHSLDYKVHRRFGELIASSAGHHAAGYYGWTKDDYVVWPPDPGSAK
jgi:hypothetical protein